MALPSCARFPGRAIPKCGESVFFAAAEVNLGNHASLDLFGIALAPVFDELTACSVLGAYDGMLH